MYYLSICLVSERVICSRWLAIRKAKFQFLRFLVNFFESLPRDLWKWIKQPEWSLSTTSPLTNITMQMIQAGSSYWGKEDRKKAPEKKRLTFQFRKPEPPIVFKGTSLSRQCCPPKPETSAAGGRSHFSSLQILLCSYFSVCIARSSCRQDNWEFGHQ